MERIGEDREGSEAQQAIDLLNRYDTPRSRKREDPDTAALRDEWLTFQRLLDARLPDYLIRLRDCTAAVPKLLPDVADRFRRWIRDRTKLIYDAMTIGAVDELQVHDLDAFDKRLNEAFLVFPKLATDLKGEAARFREAKYGIHFDSIHDEIRRAYNRWPIGTPWKLFEQLEVDAPTSFADRVRAVKEELEAISKLHTVLVQLLAGGLQESPPDNWSKFRMVIESGSTLHTYLADRSVPSAWLDKIRQEVNRSIDAASDFLKYQAETARTLDDICSLWTSYGACDPARLDSQLSFQSRWFEPSFASIEQSLSEEIVACAVPKELESIAERLARGLPDFVVKRLASRRDSVLELVAKWKALESGEAVDLPPPPIPRMLLNEAEARQNAIESVQQRLDLALGQWNVDEFLRLCPKQKISTLYRQLRQAGPALRTLAQLARHTGFSSVEEASQWEAAWKAAVTRLPAARPAALVDAMSSEVSLRRTAQSELVRAETVSIVEQNIGQKQFDLAEIYLKKLPEQDREFRRLLTRLKFERAKDKGLGGLAQMLFEDWGFVSYYCKPESHDVLLQSLHDAWEQSDQMALSLLRSVADRALEDPQLAVQIRQELEGWRNWLGIEDALSQRTTSPEIWQLISFWRSQPSPDAQTERLEHLVRLWRTQKNRVALSWAYQAFASLRPPIMAMAADPAEELVRESTRTAEAIWDDLQNREAWSAKELDEHLRAMNHWVSLFRDLNDFLDLLAHDVKPWATSARFGLVLKTLDNLSEAVMDIEQLESADLRSPDMRTLWKAAFALVAGLSGVSAAVGLRGRLEILEPLTKLQYSENVMFKAADVCKDDLDARGVFSNLQQCIREIIQVFEEAGAVGIYMWKAVSADYWKRIPGRAGCLSTSPHPADLNGLAELAGELEADERRFQDAIFWLKANAPIVGGDGVFHPEKHRDYLAQYPKNPPSSQRVYRLFGRFVGIVPQPHIVSHLRGIAWITECVRGGKL